MCLAQPKVSKARDSPMHGEQEADCPGRSTSQLDKNSPNMNALWGKGAAVQEDLSLPKILSKRAGQALEPADIGWPREQADATRAHLLEEEEEGGKGPDPLTII